MPETVRWLRSHGDLVLLGTPSGVAEAEVRALEDHLGTRLPADHRAFLVAADGCRLSYAVRLPPDDPAGELVSFDDLVEVRGPHGLAAQWDAYPSSAWLDPGLPGWRDEPWAAV
ncbi:SMI1/KNR4 family protein [Nocardioides litoris]|uniref:SMI1/KNR4 family protein n=1 Tax=Nocardioides litoris TaxID=1926648 RepID=UPI00111F2E98|nr:SMI1/KNR4 family protein [Nocardioides litoris]